MAGYVSDGYFEFSNNKMSNETVFINEISMYVKGNEDEYEIGLCHDKLGLVYDTHITGDVLGSLSEEDVEDVLKQVSELPERTKEDNDRYIECEENRYKNHERWLKESEQEYLTKQK